MGGRTRRAGEMKWPPSLQTAGDVVGRFRCAAPTQLVLAPNGTSAYLTVIAGPSARVILTANEVTENNLTALRTGEAISYPLSALGLHPAIDRGRNNMVALTAS